MSSNERCTLCGKDAALDYVTCGALNNERICLECSESVVHELLHALQWETK